jgi:hypothetical protein
MAMKWPNAFAAARPGKPPALAAAWQALPSRLRLVLAFTLAATALSVVLLPEQGETPAAPLASSAMRSPAPGTLQRPTPGPAGPSNLPALARSVVALQELAEADPFATSFRPLPPAPVQAPPVTTPNVPFVGPPPRPPAEPGPTPQARLAGWIRTTDGVVRVLLSQGNADVQAVVGLVLADGFVVQSIGPQSMRLFHPPTRTHHELALPTSLPKEPGGHSTSP